MIGPGLMGAQIGAEYALGGHTAVLVATSAAATQAAVARAQRALVFLGDAGLAERAAVSAAIDRIHPGTTIAESARTASIVVESVPEQWLTKVEVMRAAARVAPDALLLSNTSSIPIGELGEAIGAPERFIGTHYWNPPTLMPLVEVIATRQTRKAILDQVLALLVGMGKEPVLAPDIPGFLWNRLQFALLREASSLVARGVQPEMLDRVVRLGLARRWGLVGPFETMALGGRDAFVEVARRLFPELSCEESPGMLERVQLSTSSELRDRASARDHGLAELRRGDLRVKAQIGRDGGLKHG